MASASDSATPVLAGLGCRVLRPDDAAYEERIQSYWSHYNKQRPWGIVQPRTAEEVSEAVKALVAAGIKFAVRSGGHTNWAGACSIADGVTIDLGLMKDVSVKDASAKIVSVGPGGRWNDVYSALQPHGLTVPGGRDGAVGVGGFLLGGGKSHFSPKVGMACDSIVNYQIVLADGRVVEANRDNEFADLHQCLKGGGNNFGIVTRFDMQAIDSPKMWAGAVIHPRQNTEKLAEAIVDFTDHLHERQTLAFVGMWTYTPRTKDIVAFCLHVSTDGDQEGKGFEKMFAAGPHQAILKETYLADFAAEVSLPPGKHDNWFTLTFKNDARIAKKACALHEDLVEYLKTIVPEHDFETQCILQPLPTLYAQRSVERGGNVLGLDRETDNAIFWLGTCSVPTRDLGEKAHARLRQQKDELEAYAQSLDADVPWRFLNYCDPSQNPLAGYGEENVAKIRAAAEKYDPEGVFQKLVPGGFKISKV